MGAASDDLTDKKRRQDAEQEQQRQNEKTFQSAGDRQFEAGMSDVKRFNEAQYAYDKAGQAAKDLKTKRASEGKIRY